jgi:hypothetical protein
LLPSSSLAGVSLTLVSSFPLRSSPVAQDLRIILKWPVVEEHQPRPWPLPAWTFAR